MPEQRPTGWTPPWKLMHPVHRLVATERGALRWIHVHLILAALILTAVVSLLTLGVEHRALLVKYSAQWFEQRYGASVRREFARIPTARIPTARLPRAVREEIPSAGSVDLRYLDQPGDQGQLGECQANSFAKQADYSLNRSLGKPRGHGQVHFNPTFLYWLAAGGQDVGSTIYQYPAVMESEGGLRQRDWTAGTQLVQPTTVQVARAARNRYQTSVTTISPDEGGGQAAMDQIRYQIGVLHNPVNVGFPVPTSYFGAGAGGWLTDWSTWADGAHANSIVACDDTISDPQHRYTGYCLLSNQWGQNWGLNIHWQSWTTTGAGTGGYIAVPYVFIEKYGFAIAVVQLGGRLSGRAGIHAAGPAFTQPGPNADKPLPPPPASPSTGQSQAVPGAGQARYIRPITARDAAVDLGRLIDAEAARTGLDPVGLLAVAGAECGLFTHSTTCDRLGGGIDVSFGCCQITVVTAHQFGVGTGVMDGYDGPNEGYVRRWENVPAQGVHLMADVLVEFRAEVSRNNGGACYPDLPQLYVAWNAGPGNSCAFIYYPTGQAGANYYGNFLGWYRWAAQFGTTVNPYAAPKPRPAPRPRGRRIRLIHVRDGRGGFWRAVFRIDHRRRCTVRYTWPRYHGRQLTRRNQPCA